MSTIVDIQAACWEPFPKEVALMSSKHVFEVTIVQFSGPAATPELGCQISNFVMPAATAARTIWAETLSRAKCGVHNLSL